MTCIDLHIHSNISNDGEFSPTEIVNMCVNAGVKVAAIADHNSVRGIKEARVEAARVGITLIPAIELDCTYNNKNLHVLGYYIDIDNSSFNEIEEYVLEQEQKNSKKRVAYIRDMGIFVDDEFIMKLSRNGVVTGEMIAEAVLNDYRNRNKPILRPYFENGERSDNPYVNFYWDFCSQGKVAYVPINYISLKEAVEIIYSAGGVPILAHPGVNVGEDKELLNKIVSQGIKGLEVYSSYHSCNQMQFYKDICEKMGIIKTVGSDFHGKTKPNIKIGSVTIEDSENDIYKSLTDLIK
ncbi:PHP domain-containing protein [Acetivibrio straminisolvens]|uniref:Metal-dependent phosphoesterase n=1 Tax=Acetivibrio straminisolvens JCM 21531 TaxID=1294263 RepID=W4V8C0_9FIRM|nr:PHP domain-containing protein [Acetivibrio straminisolvens]GAE89645.1 metal-dependent phosphoesterase [Acetivibrio straminisolvens JCM 21531]